MSYLINSKGNRMIFGYILGGVWGCFGGMFGGIWVHFGRFLGSKILQNYRKQKLKIIYKSFETMFKRAI